MHSLPSEWRVVLMVTAIQLINTLDFMLVMPLGPDFAQALGISTAHIGIVGGSYTLAAALGGLLTARYLDRFDRRSAAAWLLAGLALSTALTALAEELEGLVAARLAAGFCGGPATAVGLAMIIDRVPSERRGRAMSWVMASFSVSAVLGVPLGLELARLGGWRLPFFVIAALGLLVVGALRFGLPPLRGHLDHALDAASAGRLLRRATLLAFSTSALVLFTGFLLIPNLSAYVQFNLGLPREQIGLLYLFGGILSFFALQLGGRASDRFGVERVAQGGTLVLILVLLALFQMQPLPLPVIPLFALYMMAQSVRSVVLQTSLTHVPRAHERAAFSALNGAVQHLAISAGALFSSLWLSAEADGTLLGMSGLAWIACATALLLPLQIHLLGRLGVEGLAGRR